MKIIQRIVIALAIMFATMVTAQAETDLSKRTHYDGQSAINAIDAMGLEVIPRKELEEVRGEGWKENVADALGAIIISYNIGPISTAKTLGAIYSKASSVYGGYGFTLAKASMSALGWEIGRYMAIRDGYPDPGAFYSPQNVKAVGKNLIPAPVRFGYNLVKK